MAFPALLSIFLALPATAQDLPILAQLMAQVGTRSLPAVPTVPAAKSWVPPREVAGVTVDGVLIVGGPEFIAATKKALAVIKAHRSHAEVLAAVGRIEQSPCSGMDVYARVPTFEVGDATWQTDTLWYAGAIVHDSRHSQLYAAARRAIGQEPDPSTWKGVNGEKAALAYQIRFLRELKASPERLAYLTKLHADPRYQEIGAIKRTVPFDPGRRPYASAGCRGRSW